VALLAGHPVITTLCDLVCSSLPYETALAHETAGGRGTGHEPVLDADRDGGRFGNGHHQHRSAALDEQSEFTRHEQFLSRSENCCSDPGVLQVSAAASRIDTSLVPAPQPGFVTSAIVLNRFNRHQQSSPPEFILAESSPARTPLVLRI